MELIGTAWNWSHCSVFTWERFQKVPRALLNHKYKTKTSASLLFFKTKTEILLIPSFKTFFVYFRA